MAHCKALTGSAVKGLIAVLKEEMVWSEVTEKRKAVPSGRRWVTKSVPIGEGVKRFVSDEGFVVVDMSNKTVEMQLISFIHSFIHLLYMQTDA